MSILRENADRCGAINRYRNGKLEHGSIDRRKDKQRAAFLATCAADVIDVLWGHHVSSKSRPMTNTISIAGCHSATNNIYSVPAAPFKTFRPGQPVIRRYFSLHLFESLSLPPSAFSGCLAQGSGSSEKRRERGNLARAWFLWQAEQYMCAAF